MLDGTTFRRYYSNPTLAEHTLTRIESSIIEGRWIELREELAHGTSSQMAVRDYADHYLEVYCKVHNRSWKRKESSLKHIKRLLGRNNMRQVHVRDIHRFVAQRLREEVKAATVNRDLTVLKHKHLDTENKTAIFNIRKAGDNALVALTSRAIEAIQQVPRQSSTLLDGLFSGEAYVSSRDSRSFPFCGFAAARQHWLENRLSIG